jgi:hypothetical protein
VSAVRIPVRHQVEGAATSTAHIEYAYPSLEAPDQPGHEREDVTLEGRQHGLAAVFGHHFVEPPVARIGNAAPVFEAPNHVVLDAAEQRHVLEHGDVVRFRRSREIDRMLGR